MELGFVMLATSFVCICILFISVFCLVIIGVLFWIGLDLEQIQLWRCLVMRNSQIVNLSSGAAGEDNMTTKLLIP